MRIISGIYTAAPWADPGFMRNSKKRLKELKRQRRLSYSTRPRPEVIPVIPKPAQPRIERFANKMRSNMTPPEKILWRALKSLRPAGIRFSAQEVLIGKRIADFYLESHRLVVEVDGKYHQSLEQKSADDLRDEELSRAGIITLRFPSTRIFRDSGSVVREIADWIDSHVSFAIPSQRNAAEPGARGHRTASREVKAVTGTIS